MRAFVESDGERGKAWTESVMLAVLRKHSIQFKFKTALTQAHGRGEGIISQPKSVM